MPPSVESLRETGAEAFRQRVATREVEELNAPEQESLPNDRLKLVNMVERLSWQEFQEKRLEQKYGTGQLAWWKALIAGEAGAYDVQVTNQGEVQENRWFEAGRRALRTVFNRRTLLGAGALATVGFLTGGTGLPALYAFGGGVAGRGLAELWSFLKGDERKAREALLKAERQQWLALEDLTKQWEATDGSETRADILLKMADLYYGASQLALATSVKEAQAELGKVTAKEEKLRHGLELGGYLVGLGGGLLAAKSLAATGGVEGGKAAFGGVDTDLSGPKSLFGIHNNPGLEQHLHAVYQENGQWNYVYNSAEEALKAHGWAAAHHAPLSQIPLEAGQWAHAWGNSDQAWKIYAYAGAKAIPVLGAMALAGTTEGMSRQGRVEAEQREARGRELARQQVLESVERGRPMPGAPEFKEPAAGQIVGVEGIGAGIGGVNQAGATTPAPWNNEWRVARIHEVKADPATKTQQLTIHFYKSKADARSGAGPESFVVSAAEWERIWQAGTAVNPRNLVSEGERRQLEEPRFVAFFEHGEGKEVKFVDKPRPEALRILANEHGQPLLGSLDLKASYQLDMVDRANNVARLRDQTKGDLVYVDLLGLRNMVKGLVVPAAGEQPAVAEAAKESPLGKWSAGKEGQQVKFYPKVTAENLQIIVDDEGKPTGDSLNPKASYKLEHVDVGNNRGQLRDLATGDSYQVDLVRLRGAVAGFVETKVTSSGKVIEGDQPADWKEVVTEFTDHHLPEPKPRQVWVIREVGLTGVPVSGPNKGQEVDLEPGRYTIQRIDRKELVIIIALVSDPKIVVRVKASDFKEHVTTDEKRLQEIFDEKEKAGQQVPDSRKIEFQQHWRFQYTGGTHPDPAPKEYWVGVNVPHDSSTIRLVDADPRGAVRGRVRRVDPLELAEKGEYLP